MTAQTLAVVNTRMHDRLTLLKLLLVDVFADASGGHRRRREDGTPVALKAVDDPIEERVLDVVDWLQTDVAAIGTSLQHALADDEGTGRGLTSAEFYAVCRANADLPPSVEHAIAQGVRHSKAKGFGFAAKSSRELSEKGGA
jgi:hypothetical protein